MSKAYTFSFKVGLGGVLMLLSLGFLLEQHRLLFFTVMMAWTLVVMFVIPPTYVLTEKALDRF